MSLDLSQQEGSDSEVVQEVIRPKARHVLTKEALAPLVARGATHKEIARHFGLNRRITTYWLQRHGMRTSRVLRTDITREKILELAPQCRSVKELVVALGLPRYGERIVRSICEREHIQLAGLLRRLNFTPPAVNPKSFSSNCHLTGNHTAILVAAKLVELGYDLFVPFGDGSRSDFVVVGRGGGRALRIQVKTTFRRKGNETMVVRLRSETTGQHYALDIDFVVGYDRTSGIAVAIDPKKFARNEINFRVSPGVSARYLDATEHLLETVLRTPWTVQKKVA